MLRIGNAQGFWGDSPSAPARLIQQQPNLDFLTLDYMSEVSMSIMAIQQEKDSSQGYAKDFLDVVRSLVPFWKKGMKFKLIANAGGLNPLGCALECQKLLKELNAPIKRIGIVSGDDVLSFLKENLAYKLFNHLENGKSLLDLNENIVTANAYLGAKAIADVLKEGAEIVITGRIADPSLTVGPCVAHYDWSMKDYDRIAGATIAGHLIECGTQVTGGISTNWMELNNKAHIGFPVVEVSDDGSCVITKPSGTGGKVSMETVKEQLLYEIGDPDRYVSPDAIVSFLSLALKNDGDDRIHISGAKGKAPPDTYKVSATFREGYRAEGILGVFGSQASAKARICGENILEHVKEAGFALDRSLIECLGNGAIVPGVISEEAYPKSLECILRVCAADKRKEALECFSKEVACMVTSGPQGITGYTSGRPHIRSVFGYWPCLIERSKAIPHTQILEVN